MEEDIRQNYSPSVMFRGTPCMLAIYSRGVLDFFDVTHWPIYKLYSIKSGSEPYYRKESILN